MAPDPIVILLRGHVPSKKNNLRPRKGGGIMNDNKDIKLAIDRLAMQIPGHVRDLRLESPEIHFYFTYQMANWDRDNAVTTLLDLFVKYGTLRDDNLAHCNGLLSIHPAERGEEDSVRVVFYPIAVESTVQRYKKKPRRANLAPVFNILVGPEADPDEEDLPEDLEISWDT